MATTHLKNYIDGRWVDAAAGQAFEDLDPATGEIIAKRKDALAREITLEMGKVLAEARGDVQEGIDMTYYIAGEGRRQFGDVVPAELPNKWAMSMRHPHGVVAAITPWNFPLASSATTSCSIRRSTSSRSPARATPARTSARSPAGC